MKTIKKLEDNNQYCVYEEGSLIPYWTSVGNIEGIAWLVVANLTSQTNYVLEMRVDSRTPIIQNFRTN